MKCLLLLPAMMAAAFAQGKAPELKLFLNGAGIAIHTESSAGRSPLSMSGMVADGPPAHRVVLDVDNAPLFAYDLELRKLADGRVLLRIDPIDPEKVRREFPDHRMKGDVSTVAAAREFPPLNVGDEVQVDIMYRPSTGEKLWDVLRIVEDRESYPRSPTAERFSFERITVKIDGKLVAERPNTWMIGKALKMQLAAYGNYYIVLTPTADFPFLTGWVDHNVLRFRAGGRQVEITGKTNLLHHSDYGTVWIYYESDNLEALNKELSQAAKIYTPSHPRIRELQRRIAAIAAGGEVGFTCADNMDQLYPKEQRAKEE